MWKDLQMDDKFRDGIRQVIKSGMGKLNSTSGLVELNVEQMAFDVNWLFFGNTVAAMDCALWHSIMFNNFNFVPEYCRTRCYKVVVRIPSVEMLLKFFNFANSIPALGEYHAPLHGKCGIDTRWYTDARYDAFFYCDGLEDGLEKYEIVRHFVDSYFDNGKDLPIILKRSCTEFERAFGPTDNTFWKGLTDAEVKYQRRLETIFSKQQLSTVQPDWHKNATISRWIEYANAIGDKSWVNYYGGKDTLTMHAVTYHPKGGDTAPTVARKLNTKGQYTKAKSRKKKE